MSFIEGLGDEVVYTCLASLPLICAFIYWCCIKESRIEEDQEDMDHPRNRPREFNPGECPICLGRPTYAVETACGHIHCGSCFEQYFNRTYVGEALPCTLCRERVGLLFFAFTLQERNTPTEELYRVIAFVRRYNRIASNDLTLLERIREFPALLRFLVIQFYDGGIGVFTFWMRIRMIVLTLFTVAYIVMPYDAVPEIVYGILGYIEDFVVLIIILMYVVLSYRGVLADQN